MLQQSKTTATAIKIVFHYIGNGHWLYISPVCKLWRNIYFDLYGPDRCTHYSSSVESIHRLDFAVSNGLYMMISKALIGSSFHLAAGAFASKDVLLHAVELGMELNIYLCTGAAKSGRYDIIRWLRSELGCPWSATMMAMVGATKGDLFLLNWIWSMEPWTPHSYYICNAAARSGQLSSLQWMLRKGCLWDLFKGGLTTEAARFGHLDTLKWLYAMGYEFGSRTAELAARGGYNDVLQWLYFSGASMDPRSLYLDAATGGSLIMLLFLNKIFTHSLTGDEINEMLLRACMKGHVPIAEYLRSLGASWPAKLWKVDLYGTDYCCFRLPALRWAISSGCPWGEWPKLTCIGLKAWGYIKEISWAHRNGCPCECPREEDQYLIHVDSA